MRIKVAPNGVGAADGVIDGDSVGRADGNLSGLDDGWLDGG